MVKSIAFKEKVNGSLIDYQNYFFIKKKDNVFLAFLNYNREANADVLIVVSMLIIFSGALIEQFHMC